MAYDVDRIEGEIDKYEYISFDLFDTLVKRNIGSPSDLFDLVEVEYNRRHNGEMRGFKQARIAAEHEAYTELQEPNLDAIYDRLDLKGKEQLKALEIELEFTICQRNIDFKPIYEYAMRKNKKIVIISDMYLPKEVVLKILKKAGIKFDYFFLSNEVGVNKRNGKIYPYVLGKLKTKAKKMLHIGDSKRADYIMPRLYGIRSVLIPRKIQKLGYFKNFEPRSLDENILVSYINNNLPMKKSYYYRVGYEVLGIILLGYAKWLNNKVDCEKMDKIFFLSREGKILRDAFGIVNEGKNRGEYLYVSRQSTRPCLLDHIESLDQFLEICIVRRGATIEDFFRYAGIEIDEYNEVLAKCHVKRTDLVRETPKMEKIFQELKDDIQKEASKKEGLLTAYLKQEDLTGKIAISDIGWHGTMQMSLEHWAKINKVDARITGYYLANFGNISANCEQHGYLYNHREDEYRIKGFIGLFENLFLADHGTTLGYQKRGRNIVPVLAEYEYSKQDDEAFREVQRGALDFVRAMTDWDELGLYVSASFAAVGIEKLGLEPSGEDLKMFGKTSLMDTRNLSLIECKHGLIEYLLHLKDFKRDMLDSSWKIGWMKTLFKLPLPYVRFLQVLYKKMDNNQDWRKQW